MAKKRRLTLQQKRRISSKKTKRAADNDDIELDDASLSDGLVSAHFGKEVLIEADSGAEQRCFYRANLELAVGDRIQWQTNQEGLGVVVKRLERNSQIQRPDSYGDLKTVAANVSQLLITIAPEPEPFAALIDRYLVAAHFHHIEPVILVNKCELIKGETIPEMMRRYENLGYLVQYVSAKKQTGFDNLQSLLKQNTSIFVGQSGVGKSSLVKSLLPNMDIRIGELSDAQIKGRHTTTHSQLFHFPGGGCCIDSPGIREFGLWHVEASDVLAGFKEIQEQAALCKFRDCSHNSEPGCAVRAALDSGAISIERFESYQLILNQLDDVDIKTRDGIKQK